MTKSAPATPKISLADRSLIVATAHAFRRETGLDWSACQLAAWDAFNARQFNNAYEAWMLAQEAAGTTYDACAAFANHPNPYRRTLAQIDSPKGKRSRAAADAVFHAQLAAKYKRAA